MVKNIPTKCIETCLFVHTIFSYDGAHANVGHALHDHDDVFRNELFDDTDLGDIDRTDSVVDEQS